MEADQALVARSQCLKQLALQSKCFFPAFLHNRAVNVRPKSSPVAKNQRWRKHRSQSLPQVILSSQTNVSAGGVHNGSASSDVDGDSQTDHDPSMWLATNNAQYVSGHGILSILAHVYLSLQCSVSMSSRLLLTAYNKTA